MLCRMARWRRIDTPKSFYAVFVGTSTVMVMLLGFLVWVAVTGNPAALAGVVFVLLMIAISIRGNRMGVYLGGSGVRSRSLLRTRTVPWVSVERFEDRRAVHNPWDLGSPLPARAIWIVRWDGETIQTSMVYYSTRFLSDEFGRTTGQRRRWVWIWSENECRAALDELNRALAQARRDLDLPDRLG